MPDVYNAKKKDNSLESDEVNDSHNQNNKIARHEEIRNVEHEKNKDSVKIPNHEVKRSEIYSISKGSVFSSYCSNPKNVNFYHKDSQEKILLLLRRHQITNIPWIFIAFLMLIAPFFFPLLSFTEMIPWEFKLVFAIVWYMITIAFIMEEFLGWFYHVNIVTDERIIEVDFVNLIYREITDANIDQIQDVTVEMGGVWRTLFKFGDVVIQTAGEVPRIRFEAVPDPDNVAKVLRELRLEEEQEKLEGRVR